MATVIIDLRDEDASRRELARSAACEASQLLDALDRTRRDDGEIHSELWRGAHLRLSTLSSITISALSDPVKKLEDLCDELYGQAGWKPQAC